MPSAPPADRSVGAARCGHRIPGAGGGGSAASALVRQRREFPARPARGDGRGGASPLGRVPFSRCAAVIAPRASGGGPSRPGSRTSRNTRLSKDLCLVRVAVVSQSVAGLSCSPFLTEKQTVFPAVFEYPGQCGGGGEPVTKPSERKNTFCYCRAFSGGAVATTDLEDCS